MRKTRTDLLIMEIAGKPAPFSIVVKNSANVVVGRKSYELPGFAQQVVNLSKILEEFPEVTVEFTHADGGGKIVFAEPSKDAALLAMTRRIDRRRAIVRGS